MATFLVASLNAVLPIPPSGPAPVKMIRQFYIAEAANDQAAVNLVAGWTGEPENVDYLAFPFNPKKATPG